MNLLPFKVFTNTSPPMDILFPWHIYLLLTRAQIFDRKFLYLMLDSMFIRAKCFNETYIFCKAALKIYVL